MVKTDYAFSIKYLSIRYPTKEDYDIIKEIWEKQGVEIKKMIYEKDKIDKLHVHGIMTLDSGFYRQKLMLPAVNINIQKIYNEEGWERYIAKQQGIKNKNIYKESLFKSRIYKTERGDETISKLKITEEKEEEYIDLSNWLDPNAVINDDNI